MALGTLHGGVAVGEIIGQCLQILTVGVDDELGTGHVVVIRADLEFDGVVTLESAGGDALAVHVTAAVVYGDAVRGLELETAIGHDVGVQVVELLVCHTVVHLELDVAHSTALDGDVQAALIAEGEVVGVVGD